MLKCTTFSRWSLRIKCVQCRILCMFGLKTFCQAESHSFFPFYGDHRCEDLDWQLLEALMVCVCVLFSVWVCMCLMKTTPGVARSWELSPGEEAGAPERWAVIQSTAHNQPLQPQEMGVEVRPLPKSVLLSELIRYYETRASDLHNSTCYQ